MSQINPRKIIKEKILKTCNCTEVQQVGIDLTISKTVVLRHGEAINVLLNESVKLPDNVYALLYGRSTYNRMCILIRGSVYDPGFENQVGVTIYNMSGGLLKVIRDERICQMVFFEADAASSYKGQYQSKKKKNGK